MGQVSGTPAFSDIATRVLANRRLPSATYRVQFGPAFTFENAERIVPYLDALGITDLYASPVLKPARDSTHGYDICDHHLLNPALGTEADFDDLAEALKRRRMGLIFDVVPNHMGIADPANVWWWDVLENGPSSPYASFFDIDWHPMKAEATTANQVLLPILGDPYGKVLESQQIVLSYANGAFTVSYYDHHMPITPRQYAEILSPSLPSLTEALGAEHPYVLELQSIITAINYLPVETETDREKMAERHREKEIIKRRIDDLVNASPEVRVAVDATIAAYNGKRGEPRSFDALDTLLAHQCYRLAFWRVAAEEINYRRFFDINDLAAIRMERPEVFDETHRLILRYVREGKVTGMRIDHADGLWDPTGYLRNLQKAAFFAQAQALAPDLLASDAEERAAGEQQFLEEYDRARQLDPRGPIARPFYVVVEKILSDEERLQLEWPVDGTTGYEFANAVNGLFVNGANRKALSDIYTSFCRPSTPNYRDLVNSTKKIIMLVSLSSEINELGYQLKRIAWRSRLYRDFTLNSLTYVIREVIAAFPIYRTYLTDDCSTIQPHDRAAVEYAVTEAKRRNPRTAAAVFDFVQKVLLQEYPADVSEQERADWSNFALRFQQTSSPVMAKGVEDTAFYVYNRLVSLNEVGGDPEKFGTTPAAFHQQNIERLRDWPYAMLAESTHDSKRSADVRARLDVLSEIPRAWRSALGRWSRRNRARKTSVYGQPCPDRNDEYLFYQTLLGAWPVTPMDAEGLAAFRQRIQDYMLKAINEAKVHTSWVNANQAYVDAVTTFVDRVLNGRSNDGFLADFAGIRDFVAYFGMLNSLSETLLRLTSPGVPDLYQGNELWSLTLVDPDNRRPVDYAERERLLTDLRSRIAEAGNCEAEYHSQTTFGQLRAAAAGSSRGAVAVAEAATEVASEGLADLARELLSDWTDGRVKLYVTHLALRERRQHPSVFTTGDYRALPATGPKKNHVVGFARADGADEYLTVVPRLMVSLTREATVPPLGENIWEDTRIELPEDAAGATYRNVLTGEIHEVNRDIDRPSLSLGSVLSSFPVALLRRM